MFHSIKTKLMAIKKNDKIFNKNTFEIGKVNEINFVKTGESFTVQYDVVMSGIGIDSIIEEVWIQDDVIPYTKIDLSLFIHVLKDNVQKIEQQINHLTQLITSDQPL